MSPILETEQVLIFTGAGPLFGKGHIERMKTLFSLLSFKNIKSKIVVYKDRLPLEKSFFSPFLNSHIRVIVLDMRDLPPNLIPNHYQIPVIAIDNRCKERNQLEKTGLYFFYDSIPHPKANLIGTLRNCLVAPEYSEYLFKRLKYKTATHLQAKTILKKEGLFFYTNSTFPLRPSESQLLYFAEILKTNKIIQVGGEKPKNTKYITYAQTLSRNEFVKRLATAEFFLGYFGITMLESLFMFTYPILYQTGSKEHDDLSLYIQEVAGIPLIMLKKTASQKAPLNKTGSRSLFFHTSQNLKSNHLKNEKLFRFRPTAEGFPILVDKIIKIIKEK